MFTDRNDRSNLYKGPSIAPSYHVSVQLAKQFQRRRFFQKLTNQKQELPMVTMFVNGSEHMSNIYSEPSIAASYQVLVHLAKRFQRRRFKCEKLNCRFGSSSFARGSCSIYIICNYLCMLVSTSDDTCVI